MDCVREIPCPSPEENSLAETSGRQCKSPAKGFDALAGGASRYFAAQKTEPRQPAAFVRPLAAGLPIWLASILVGFRQLFPLLRLQRECNEGLAFPVDLAR